MLGCMGLRCLDGLGKVRAIRVGKEYRIPEGEVRGYSVRGN